MNLGQHPAYPVSHTYMGGEKLLHFGMSIRQRYAMAALQGLLGNPQLMANESDIAKQSFLLADAMVAFEEQEYERRKTEENATTEEVQELGDKKT